MRKYITLFFSVLLFCACGKVPHGIIDPDEMVGLLTEVHITDAILSSTSPAEDSLYKNGTGKYLVVFKKFHTDSAQFTKSYKYYTMHPDMLVDIYDKVLKNLKAKTDSITKIVSKNNEAQAKRTLKKPNGAHKVLYTPNVPNTIIPQKQPPPPFHSANARAAFERLQAHRDSLMKKQKNAVPAK